MHHVIAKTREFMLALKRAASFFVEALGLRIPALKKSSKPSKEDNLRKRLEEMNWAIERSPNVGHYYSQRSYFHRQLNEHDAAVEDLGNAIKYTKDVRELSINFMKRGFIYASKKQFVEAESDLNEAIRLNPDIKVNAYFGMGHGYETAALFDKALEYYDTAIASSDSSTSRDMLRLVYEGRKNVYIKCRQYDDALYNLDKLWQLDKRDVKVLQERASIKTRVGKIEAALSDMNTVVEIEPKNLNALEFRAFLYVLKDDFATAEQYCVEVLRKFPESWQSHDTRGYIHFIKQEYDAALAHFQKVIDAAGEQLSGVYQGKVGQGLTLYAQGRKDEALAVWHELSAKHSAYHSVETLRDYYILPQQALEVAEQLISDAQVEVTHE
jgi:tetratricopeptide (TPR) repeat protein